MSRFWRRFAWAAVLACCVVLADGSWGGDPKSYQGEITDSQCALNVHSLNRSHKEMMAMKPEIKTNTECARYCVKERGGRFVLLAKDKVYKLDAQALAEQWVGVKVRVLGTLDPKTDLITVEGITAQAAANPTSSKQPN